MQPSLTHKLGRAVRLRLELELERHRAGPHHARLLRLQALLLRAQKHLADLIGAAPQAAMLAPARSPRERYARGH